MNQLRMRVALFITIFLLFILSSCSQPGEPVAQTETGEEFAGAATQRLQEDLPGETEEKPASQRATQVELPHIHGLGFSADGRQLFVAAHDGLRVFSEGQWLVPELPAHDYMGYTATDSGFYSSGHPHPSSGLVNPLGLVKSEDGGQSLISLGFEGESDFHLMGVGYENHAIYVFNPAPNSQLSAGLHYSLDDGQTWKQSALQGLTANPIQIAVHPTEANRIALATEGGLFLSADYGNTLQRIGNEEPVTAITFVPEGDRLLFGTQSLLSYDLTDERVTGLSTLPIAADDAIAHIAINPAQPTEMVLATFQRHMYRSVDAGQSWVQIVRAGKGQSERG